MKSNKALGIAWIAIAAILLLFLVTGIIRNNDFSFNKDFSNENYTFNSESSTGSYNFSEKEVNSILLNLTSAAITFEDSANDKIYVELYGFEKEKNIPKVKLNGDVLEIEQKRKTGINFHIANIGKKAVLVKLPVNYNPDSIEAYSASGSINLKNCTTLKGEFKTASGSIHIENCTSDSLEASSASGSIYVANCQIKELECTNASGSIQLDGACDSVELRSVSGSVHANLTKPLTKNSEIASTSGSIRLSIPAESNLNIKYSAVSGTYNNSLSGTSGKKGKDIIGTKGPELELRTNSGSIKVN